MNKKVFLPFISLICYPLFLFLSEVLNMESITAAIIAGSATIFTAISAGTITLIIECRRVKQLTKHLGFGEDEESMKRQLERKLGVSDKSVASQLGVSDKSITAQLGVSDKSIAAQLGVGNDDKSLTKQHEQLKSELMVQLSGISSFLSAKDEKAKKSLKRLKENQADIAQRLSDMSTVFEGYIQLLNTVEEQSRTIEQLRADNAALRQQVAELQERNSDHQDYDLEM